MSSLPLTSHGGLGVPIRRVADCSQTKKRGRGQRTLGWELKGGTHGAGGRGG